MIAKENAGKDGMVLERTSMYAKNCSTYSVVRLTWDLEKKESKGRVFNYIAPFIYYVYLKALRHASHSFTCKYTMPAFPS